MRGVGTEIGGYQAEGLMVGVLGVGSFLNSLDGMGQVGEGPIERHVELQKPRG